MAWHAPDTAQAPSIRWSSSRRLGSHRNGSAGSYANVPGDGLVQLRALGVTPDYIAGFQRLGYRDLAVSELVQLKALDITPEFVRATVGQQAVMPPVEKLVEYKMFGRRR